MTARRTALLILTLTFLLAAGCGARSDNSDTVSPNDSNQDRADSASPTTEQVNGRLAVRIDGAVELAFDDDDAELQIHQLTGAGPRSRFTFGNLFAPIRAGDAFFAVAVDLLGVYEGAGTYEIPVTTETSLPDPEELDLESLDPDELLAGESRVRVTHVEVTEEGGEETPASGRMFDRVLETCALEVGENARTGSLDCRRIADAHNATISLSMEWSVA